MEYQIRFLGMKPTRPISRFAQHQLEKWIEREQSLHFFPKPSHYQVTIERESDPRYFFVQLEVSIGSRTWESHEGGRSLQDAFFQALKHLKPTVLKNLRPTSIRRAVESVA